MNKLLVVSSYPGAGEIHHKKTVGIASYAKNTLLGIKKADPSMDILVLAEKLSDQKGEYDDDGIKVKRVWKRGNILSFFNILFEVLKSGRKNILYEFEVSMFGNPVVTAPFPILIGLLRILGKRNIVVVHQTINDLSEFEGHTNIKAKSLKSLLLGNSLKLFYKFLLLFSNRIIVFEDALKDKLSKGNSKIVVIPHGVQNFENIYEKDEAREKLGLPKDKKILLLFGYIAWYKGTDWAVNVFQKVDPKDILLVIGGGPNPNHLSKKFYVDYVENIKNKASEKIRITDFIEEKEIPLYYGASDAVILPYRTFMSASGPLSIAYSFEKPAFVSSKLSGIYQANDIKDEVEKRALKVEDLVFDLDEESFNNLLKRVEDKSFIEKNANLSEAIRKKRGFDKIGLGYIKAIF